MNFYYGIVDKEHKAWGFIEETDSRVTSDMIFVQRDYWKQLLNEQSEGKEIVSDGTRVFTAEPGKYYTDANGIWHEKTDEQLAQEKAQAREENFKKGFFNIENYGWFRKTPKGYDSAINAVNTAFNMVSVVGKLPAGTLIFYTAPDFTNELQCSEEWLIEHQIKSPEMDTVAFGQFYAAFIQAWNTQEHKN